MPHNKTKEKMTFYHGMTDNRYKEALLKGYVGGSGNDRIYLATKKIEAMHYGNTVIRIKYDPLEHPDKNNYCEGCWQLRVYEPIFNFKKVSATLSSGRTVQQLIEYKGRKGFLFDCNGYIFIECGHNCKKDFTSFNAWHKHVTKEHNSKDSL